MTCGHLSFLRARDLPFTHILLHPINPTHPIFPLPQGLNCSDIQEFNSSIYIGNPTPCYSTYKTHAVRPRMHFKAP